MDFDADYDSEKKMYKNTQPTHFFGIFSFFENFSKFLLWDDPYVLYGAHIKALPKLHQMKPRRRISDIPSASCATIKKSDFPMLEIAFLAKTLDPLNNPY